MAVKIRLQRHGKKNFAFFHIVVADSRAPRDGRYIEQIGSYNPNTNPATIVLDNERALAWVNVGAQPTLTAKRILSYEGVLLQSTSRRVLRRVLLHRSRLMLSSQLGSQRRLPRSAQRRMVLERTLLLLRRLLQRLSLR